MSNYFIDHYGEEAQYKKLAEELIELLIALVNNGKISPLEIKKIIRQKRNSSNIVEEMADVDNLISQFSEHFNDGKILAIKHEKQKRQRK